MDRNIDAIIPIKIILLENVKLNMFNEIHTIDEDIIISKGTILYKIQDIYYMNYNTDTSLYGIIPHNKFKAFPYNKETLEIFNIIRCSNGKNDFGYLKYLLCKGYVSLYDSPFDFCMKMNNQHIDSNNIYNWMLRKYKLQKLIK